MNTERQALAIRQQELVSMIFDLSLFDDVEAHINQGLKIYQNNLLLTATRSLTISYPVLTKLVGEKAIRGLARLELKRTLPDSGDWAQWGQSLWQTVEQSELAVEHPYLRDIAKLEWCIHKQSRSVGNFPKLSSLFLLEELQPESVAIELSNTLQVFESDHPVHAIWLAHQNAASKTFDEDAFSNALNQIKSERMFITYEQDGANVESITDAEFYWLGDVAKGLSLSVLLDRHPNMDFAGWLSKAIDKNWIHKLYQINTEPMSS